MTAVIIEFRFPSRDNSHMRVFDLQCNQWYPLGDKNAIIANEPSGEITKVYFDFPCIGNISITEAEIPRHQNIYTEYIRSSVRIPDIDDELLRYMKN